MQPARLPTRRALLAATAAGFGVIVARGTVARAAAFRAATARPRLAVIGCGARWDKRVMDPAGNYGVGKEFPKFADIVTVCDVDAERLGRAREIVKGWQGVAPAATGDYRQVIDDAAVDALHISTPDHWHAKIAIEALHAGKDVYCEKPLTLTIDEGKRLREAVRTTGRIVQVGTQQRSEMRFITAVALVQSGRLGKLTRIQCAVGEGPTSPLLPAVAQLAGSPFGHSVQSGSLVEASLQRSMVKPTLPAFQLFPQPRGALQNLKPLRLDAAAPLAPGHVMVAVRAVGINFR